MSEVLLEFISPYRDKAADDAALERLIGLGIMAWNVALLPEAEREKTIDEFAERLFTPSRFNPKYWLSKLLGPGMRDGKVANSSERTDFKEVINEMVCP